MEDGQWTRDDRRDAARRRDLAAALEHLPACPRPRVGRDRCAHLGTLVRYADDFVVLCDTKAAVRGGRAARARSARAARARATSGEDETSRPLARQRGLRLPRLSSAQAHERAASGSGRQQRVYFLQRWPSQRAMQRMRQRVRDLTPRARCHADLRDIIARAQPGAPWLGRSTFAPGTPRTSFSQIDRLRRRASPQRLLVKRAGPSASRRSGRPQWTADFFEALGLHRLRGTIQYPEAA